MHAQRLRQVSIGGSLVVSLLFSASASASLLLNTGVTGTFNGNTTWTNTAGNDLPGAPTRLYYGQLQATQAGAVDFYFLGNEAAYTNSIVIGGSVAHTSAGLPDNFNSHQLIGSVGANAGSFVDFGFCTNGGNSVGASGRCVENDSAASQTAQFNYQNSYGYRSIAFRPLSSFDASTGARTFASLGGASDLWALFWDDSGAKNDDNHDDYIAVARFRAVQVPEPATAAILGAGLLALGLRRRRQA